MTMNKVYCVFYDYPDGDLQIHRSFEGVFTTKEKAERFIKKENNTDMYIEEWGLDDNWEGFNDADI